MYCGQSLYLEVFAAGFCTLQTLTGSDFNLFGLTIVYSPLDSEYLAFVQLCAISCVCVCVCVCGWVGERASVRARVCVRWGRVVRCGIVWCDTGLVLAKDHEND